jgi:phenylpropionate dioxygenase-like ring-hydroxylating dioxygenase large terminal subunit
MDHPETVANLKSRMQTEQARAAARSGPPDGFPKLPPLPPGRYTSQEFYELELAHLWKKTWLYAGHVSQIPKPGDYLLLDIPWAAIFLIRGKDDQVRAFYNVCQHRGAPVVTKTQGNESLLRCTYHQWTYNTAGKLVSVMYEDDFDAEFDKSCLGLPEVRCELWNGLVFINEDQDAPPLLEWLGMIRDEFEPFQLAKLRPAAIKSYELTCNWKLTMDAFLEVYHIKGIHPKTVGAALDERGAVMGLLPNGHTRMTCPMNLTPTDEQKRRGYDAGDGAMQPIPLSEIAAGYHVSHNIFPNIITPVSATSRQFLMFWPLAKDRTRVDVVHFGLDWGDGERPSGWDTHLAFWDIVMAEDLQFLEWQQKAVVSPGFKGYRLSYMERRIYYAHESIDRMIGAEHIPEHLRAEPVLADWREYPAHHAADPYRANLRAAE